MRLNFYSALVAISATSQVFFSTTSILPGAQAVLLEDLDTNEFDEGISLAEITPMPSKPAKKAAPAAQVAPSKPSKKYDQLGKFKAAAAISPDDSDSDSDEDDGPEYSVDCTLRNYADSVKFCESQGLQIASIHDEMYNEVIGEMVKANCDAGQNGAYIGAESDNKGNWSWKDGSPWDFVPKKNDGIAGIKVSRMIFNTDGLWHDWGNGEAKHGVVCMDPPTPTLKKVIAPGTNGAGVPPPATPATDPAKKDEADEGCVNRTKEVVYELLKSGELKEVVKLYKKSEDDKLEKANAAPKAATAAPKAATATPKATKAAPKVVQAPQAAE